MYALVEDGVIKRVNISLPISIGNTSIPKGAANLSEFGLYPMVGAAPQPYSVIYTEQTALENGLSEPVLSSATQVGDYDPRTHMVVGPTYSFDGAQVNLSYTIEMIPNHEAAFSVRGKRNALLAETDWWAGSDLTMTAEQTAYRQALRDITAHANFPYLEETDWPVKP